MDWIIVLALVVLPGWVSTAANQLYNPRETDRSTLMQWGMLIYHAAVIHAFVILMIVVLTLIWPNFFLETLDVDSALTEEFGQYLKASEVTGIIIVFIYLFLLVTVALISGIVDVPSKLVNGVGKIAKALKLAQNPVMDVPLWYQAWRVYKEDGTRKSIQVLARIKNGDVYIGQLSAYQGKVYDSNGRDIILSGKVTFLPDGNASKAIALPFEGKNGGVLINSENISSIEYLYND